jgi:hypothetical protein
MNSKCKKLGIKSPSDNNLDPAVLDLNMEILKSPTSTDMWELVIYDDAAIV